jgi:hypothetical protein
VSPGGIIVSLVRPDRSRTDEVLIRVDGSHSELEGKVLLCRVDRIGRGYLHYRAPIHGRIRAIVSVQTVHGTEKYRLLLKSGSDPIPITYNDDRTRSFDSRKFIEQYEKQKTDGTLAALQDFNRQREIDQNERKLQAAAENVNKACSTQLQFKIDWDSVGDDFLKKSSIGGICADAIGAMRRLCAYEPARVAFGEKVRELVCRLGTEMRFDLQEGRMSLTLPARPKNLRDRIRSYLLEKAPLVPGGTLKARIELDKVRICTDGKSHYVGQVPHESEIVQVVFGDDKKLYRVRKGGHFVSAGWFFEPREYEPKNSSNFRGLDLRHYSHFSVDLEKNTCRLTCGNRKIDLRPLDRRSVEELMARTEIHPPIKRRKPYALTRDRKGNYYFIDVTDEPDARDFQLFRGPKGNLKQLKMVNVVLDSKGDVFATKSGSLRLVIEKEHSFWVQKEKTQPLLNLPIHENYRVIYSELGVYLGVRLGTPCDEL